MTARKTEEVLAAARGELQGQLHVVRNEIAQLTTEERALTQALSGLGSRTPDTSSRRTGARSSAREPAPRRRGRRRRPGTGKSNSDRVEEVRALLAEGPKSRNELAAALKVSPPRIQQLLAELGNAVASERDPNQRQGKLWRLKRGGNPVS